MKEALTKNLGLKLLALGCSVFLWFVVMNLSNPVTKKVFTGISVTVAHPEIVTNQGNTYQVLNGSNTVSVTVRAQRSVLEKIRKDDITATADMRKLDVSTRSLIPIDVLVATSGDYSAKASQNLQVSIEAGKSETFPITATSSGTPRDGYELGALVTDPEKIKISGPESVIDLIDKVVAEVNVSGLSEDVELPAELILYDSAGSIIDTTQIEHNLGEKGLKVKVTLLHTKTIPVEFDTSLVQPAEGYHFTGINIQPVNVQVVGTKDDLETLEKIEVPASELEETGLTESMEKTVDIRPYLPEWAKTDENAGVPVLVKILIEKYGTRTIEYPANAITMVNVPKGYKAVYKEQGNIDIIVTGSREDLEDLTLEKGSVSINLINCKNAGSYTIPVQVTLPSGIELEKEITVQITLEESDGDGNEK